MVRQRSRNTVEEVYGTKFDATKSSANNNNSKSSRDHGYIITSNMPYNTINTQQSSSIANNGLGSAPINTSRRKSARPNTKSSQGNANKYGGKEEKDDGKKEHNTKMKTSRNAGGCIATKENCQYNSVIMSHQNDNKTYRPHNETNRDVPIPVCDNNTQSHHNHHNHQNYNQRHNHHHNHNHNHDDDKDDDTEEFFELIRQTVEGAIGKSVSELLNRNFRELSAKVERFSAELKNTNELLVKMQMDLNDKIVHYGEENSRHFRYLCMKSEYDKMFYQHQSMMAAAVVPSNTSQSTTKPATSAAKVKSSVVLTKHNKEVDESAPCTCRSNNTAPVIKSKDTQKSSSDEHNVSQKSSEVGMREVLDHIQRFCTQMQMNDKKAERPSGSKGCGVSAGGGGAAEGIAVARLMDTYMQETRVNINRDVFGDDDDDELEISSDGMTPRSDDEQQMQKYGGMTMRTCSTARAGENCIGSGGGDA